MSSRVPRAPCRPAGRRGIALLLTLIVVAVAGALSVTLVAQNANVPAIVSNRSHHGQARAIAESALEIATVEVERNAQWRTDYADGIWLRDLDLLGGTFTLSGNDGEDTNGDGVVEGDANLADDPDDPVTFTAVGRYGNTTHTVSACLRPSASTGGILFVVSDTTAPTAQESTRRALLESWGYPVRLVAAADSQTTFNDAVARSTVAYVSVEVDPIALGTKLRAAPIGVVSEQVHLEDAFGMATDHSFPSPWLSTVEIVDNTHPITAMFSIGVLTIFSAPMPVAAIAGTTAPGLDVLGQFTPSDPGLYALDAGDQMVGGGAAAGRRVGLPWGGSDTDIALLTDQGRTLLRRAIEWAAGDTGIGDPLIARWKFDDGTGSTAIDSAGEHDGTLWNGPVWTTGKILGGLQFDGSNHVEVPADPALDVSCNATITGWFKLDTPFDATSPASRIILSKYLTDDHNLLIALVGTEYGRIEVDRGALLFKAENGADTFHIRYVWTNRTSWNAGEWYHFVATLDSSDHSQNSLAVNGVDDTSTYSEVPTSERIDMSFNVNIQIGGRDADEGQLTEDRFFEGIIDDIRIYGIKLSALEIADLYATGNPGVGAPRTYSRRWRERR